MTTVNGTAIELEGKRNHSSFLLTLHRAVVEDDEDATEFLIDVGADNEKRDCGGIHRFILLPRPIAMK